MNTPRRFVAPWANSLSKLSVSAAPLRSAWNQRTERERRLLLLALALLLGCLLWQVALAPAWTLWRQAPAQQALLDVQHQTMQRLQAQAQALQASPRLNPREALALVQRSSQQWLGADAAVRTQGQQVQVTLKAVPAAALAQWLTQVRTQAHAQVLQAQLSQMPAAPPANAQPTQAPTQMPAPQRGIAAAASAMNATAPPARKTPAGDAATLWQGTVVLRLP